MIRLSEKITAVSQDDPKLLKRTRKADWLWGFIVVRRFLNRGQDLCSLNFPLVLKELAPRLLSACPGMGQRANKKVKIEKPSVVKHQKWIKIYQINSWCLAGGWNVPCFT